MEHSNFMSIFIWKSRKVMKHKADEKRKNLFADDVTKLVSMDKQRDWWCKFPNL
jgi:hypothetical protein